MDCKKVRLYKKAKNIIGDKTPLKKDCGKVCDHACCKGDSKTGMLLFPGEETTLNIIEKGDTRLAVCNGKCNRKERPLSCMIFPFFPCVTNEGRIKVTLDIRGYDVCPLVKNFNDIKFDRVFLRRVREVGRLLIEDEECKIFMEQVSREIELLSHFHSEM